MSIERRRLGRTNIEVTTLGLGGGPIGKAPDGMTAEDAHKVVDTAWMAGVRYFDTAPLYGLGRSEERLGSKLATFPRDQFVLSSKVGRLLVPDPEGEGSGGLKVRYDYSYEGARASIERSLARLGLERINIVLSHDIDTWTHAEAQPGIYAEAACGILPALADLRRQGVVGAWGLGVNESAVCSRVLEEFEPDCFLLAGRFTLLEQAPLDDLLPRCMERGVSIIIGGPFNSGLLAVGERQAATYDYQPVDDERWERAQRIRSICEAHGVDIRAAALQYPLRHPAVASVIPGAWRVEEVEVNAAFVQSPIPDSLWNDLDSAGLARKIQRHPSAATSG